MKVLIKDKYKLDAVIKELKDAMDNNCLADEDSLRINKKLNELNDVSISFYKGFQNE